MAASPPADSLPPPRRDPVEEEEEEEEFEEGGGPNCLLVGGGSFVSGGVMGGLFGMAGGVFKPNGLKVAMQEGATSAKTFALMSGVHSLVSCTLQRIRNKEDVINQGVAGCASGIALGIGGPPTTMLVNCAGFAAFAFIYEFLTTRSANAMTMSRRPSPRPLRSARKTTAKGRRSQQGCQLPVCRVANQLQEVLSLGLPCWRDQSQGCQIGPKPQ